MFTQTLSGLCLGCVFFASAHAGDQIPAPATAPTVSPEEQLWQRVTALRAEPATTQPYHAWLDWASRQRQQLLHHVQLYLTLYPGGAHAVAAVRIELATLYELGALRGGQFAPLCARVRELLTGDAHEPAVWEAAYWDIHCRRLDRHAATTQPTSAAVLEPDDQLLTAYRQYLARYPRSPYVPRLAAMLAERAIDARDTEELRRLVETLKAHFPEHLETEWLVGTWQRESAVGQPFWLTFTAADERRLDTREFAGRPVLIVVWDSFEAVSHRRAAEVEQFRRAHPEVEVVGVNLDIDRQAMQRTCTELGLHWPQFNDDLGPANRFAREWGVRRAPRVFVIDRRGRLVGATEKDDWKQLASAAVVEPRP